MKEKKNIDRLFQEGFKDFEATPNDAVWQEIESRLNQQKKKRRILPLWWRYAGIAALLLLLLTIGGVYFNDSQAVAPSNQVVDSKNETSPQKLNNNNAISNVKETIENNNRSESKEAQNPLNNNISTAVASSKNEAPVTQENQPNSFIKRQKQTPKELIKKQDDTKNHSNKIEQSQPNSLLANNQEPHKEQKDSIRATPDYSTIAKTEDKVNSSKTDSITKTKQPSIEDAIAQTEKNTKENIKPQNKWLVTPNAAPVYFNSLGKGSSLDSQFNNNSKSGEVNMSYGVIASYAITKNLKIRSGINQVNLGYNTNNVLVYESAGLSSSSSSSIKNINSNDSATPNVSLVSGETLSVKNNAAAIKTTHTSINQTLGYIEVPLEIEYAIVNKKFGVNVIGGFSSFFLNNNKLYSDFGGQRNFLGEATNLNKISYSANFGLGLNYKMTKKFELNLEPLFKYQINTFSNTSGNFKPFFIGVYTGIGFKF